MALLHRSLRGTGALLALAAVLCLGLALAGFAWQASVSASQTTTAVLQEAGTLAAAIDAGAEASHVLAAVPGKGFVAAYLLDARGRQQVQSTRSPLAHGGGGQEAGAVWVFRDGGTDYVGASASVVGGGRVVVVASPVGRQPVLGIAAGALVLWLVISGLVVAAFIRARRADPAIAELTESLVDGEVTPAERADAIEEHGTVMHSLFDVAEHLASARRGEEEARTIGSSLLQMGAHYTILCRLDGRLLDGNAAFFARTGSSYDDLRAPGSLDTIIPMAPLKEFALRSLEEETTLSGIQHSMIVGDETRPVEIALRAVRLRDYVAILMTIADHARQRELEQQIDQFTDAVELMVDQRVARITEGQLNVEEALATAGVAIFHLDRQGALLKVNRAAEQLTGRTQFTMPHFNNAAAQVCTDATERGAFSSWFWSGSSRPFESTVRAGGVSTRIAWVCGEYTRDDKVTRRLLIGLKLPPADPLATVANPLQRIETLAASLDVAAMSADARSYVDVIREAVRRLESSGTPSGDGAAPGHVRAVQ